MKYETAKELLLSEGYRIVSEDFEDDVVYDDVVDTNQEALPAEGEEQLDSDVYGAVEQGLGDEGFDAQEVADIMTANNERIDELSQKGVAAEDIVKILAYENCECDGQNPEDFGDETVDDTAVEYDDVPVDEAYMTEGKSKPKGDKFSHKEKVAGRKPKGCCGKKGCKDCDDDELDESFENGEDYPIECLDIFELLIGRGYDDIGAKSWIKVNKNKIEMFLDKGYSAEDIVYELDGDLAGDMDESLEDDFPETFRKPNTVQHGTDDWSDFKDDFRKKTLTLKKALTPQFVSGIIKDTDFEVDDKEIKAYAFTIIEDVYGTKDPVRNIQARIRNHFVK